MNIKEQRLTFTNLGYLVISRRYPRWGSFKGNTCRCGVDEGTYVRIKSVLPFFSAAINMSSNYVVFYTA